MRYAHLIVGFETQWICNQGVKFESQRKLLLRKLNLQGVPKARKHSATIVGTGLCPEGINQNYFMYDFMSEASLRPNPINATDW